VPSRPIYSDKDLLDFSGKHLLYEFQVFFWVATNMPSGRGFPLSVSLESFAIHLRNLIDFFYRPPQPPDDIGASDFYDPLSGWVYGTMSSTLEVARERANKEVSHITFKRKTGMAYGKPWDVSALSAEIKTLAQRFAAGASSKKLHPDVATLLNASSAMMTTLLIGASGAMTNTTSTTLTTSSAATVGQKPSKMQRLFDCIFHK
jgi:hypothetical protein